MTVSSGGLDDVLSRAKRNVAILTAAQAVQGAVSPLAISLGGLVGYQLLGPDKALATAPSTGLNIGTAVGAALSAIILKYLGRKHGFIVGALIAACGAALAAIALIRMDFWMFVAALMLIGISSGFTQKYRFAAADASPSFYKATAISWILVGGIVSAVIGPQLAIWMRDQLPGVPFAGAFLAVIPLTLISTAILSFLHVADPTDRSEHHQTSRPLAQIVATPRFLTGLLCGVSASSLMTFMMTGAPLAMVIGCGYSTEMSTLGIQWHVLAMFAPSFVTGKLIVRFGVERVVAAGLVLLMLCAIVAVSGIALWNFWGSLVLLGVGWNFGFIGATAIVASSYKQAEADKVQGFHDIVLFSVVALASLSAGKVFSSFGWNVMTLITWPVCIVCLVALAALRRNRPRLPRAD